jgi:hypothetical protein
MWREGAKTAPQSLTFESSHQGKQEEGERVCVGGWVGVAVMSGISESVPACTCVIPPVPHPSHARPLSLLPTISFVERCGRWRALCRLYIHPPPSPSFSSDPTASLRVPPLFTSRKNFLSTCSQRHCTVPHRPSPLPYLLTHYITLSAPTVILAAQQHTHARTPSADV